MYNISLEKGYCIFSYRTCPANSRNHFYHRKELFSNFRLRIGRKVIDAQWTVLGILAPKLWLETLALEAKILLPFEKIPKLNNNLVNLGCKIV